MGRLGDVSHVPAVRLADREVAFDQVREAPARLVRRIVVFTRRRSRIPASWCSRITRATRLRLTRSIGATPLVVVVSGDPRCTIRAVAALVGILSAPGSAPPTPASAA